MISALPVSGAWHPNTIGAHCDRPRISLSSASLSCPYPCPPRSGLRCVPHTSRRRTSSFNGSTTFRRVSSSGVNASPGHTRSSGSTSSRTNESTQSSFSWNSGSVSKSHGIVLPLGNWSGRFDDDSDGAGRLVAGDAERLGGIVDGIAVRDERARDLGVAGEHLGREVLERLGHRRVRFEPFDDPRVEHAFVFHGTSSALEVFLATQDKRHSQRGLYAMSFGRGRPDRDCG